MKSKIWEMAAGGVAGYQLPLGAEMEKKKKKMREVLEQADLPAEFISRALEHLERTHVLEKIDDPERYIASLVESLAMPVVQQAVDEFVKKMPDGGFALYKPHRFKNIKGKIGPKEPTNKVGQYTSRLAAKRVELAKFPPENARALYRLRAEIDRLSNGGEQGKRRKRKKATVGVQKPKNFMKGESKIRDVISFLVSESLFREERKESEWQTYIDKLSPQAVANDQKLKRMQDKITKQSDELLHSAYDAIRKGIGKGAKLDLLGVKKNTDGTSYLAFGAEIDSTTAQPIYIYLDKGLPKIDVSDEARASLTKADADTVKLFRADLISVQERVLDKMDKILSATEARDKYLKKLQDGVDEYLATLNPLQISLLKNLVIKKYRKTN